MAKFRKKPVLIEAVQWGGYLSNEEEVRALCGESLADPYDTKPLLVIRTLEGDMTAHQGDWIIRGVKGECYPCKPDIFAMTYEPASGVMATGPTKEDELRQALQAANENTRRWKEKALNLRAALEPFALALDRFEGTPGVHFDDSLELWQVDNGTGKLCVRDLRRARDALLPHGVIASDGSQPE